MERPVGDPPEFRKRQPAIFGGAFLVQCMDLEGPLTRVDRMACAVRKPLEEANPIPAIHRRSPTDDRMQTVAT